MRLTYGLIFFLFHFAVFAQDLHLAYTEVKGVLIDSLTSQPIPSAHIRTRHFTVTSNPYGVFSILALPNDSIHISHIGYYARVFSFHSITRAMPLKIAMIQKVTQLNSVIILGLSEESFKRKILDTTPVLSLEEQNAKTNIAVLNYYIKSLPQLPMSGYENFREQMKGPQGIIIFSTGGQGLIKAIRNVIKTRPVPYKSFSNHSSTSDIKRNALMDSLANARIRGR